MNMFLCMLVLTALAGIGGTGLGAGIAVSVRKRSERTMGLLLSFAGGTMISIVCMDLLHDAKETGVSAPVIALLVLIGFLIVWFLESITNQKMQIVSRGNNARMTAAGIIMIFAVAVHNVPVGMSIGASLASHTELWSSTAVLLAILIGIHNVPEGMAVCAPFLAGGLPKGKAVCITSLCGATMIIGGILGFHLGTIGDRALAVALSFASGAMLYVTFGEILPEASEKYRGKFSALLSVCGVLTGIFFMH